MTDAEEGRLPAVKHGDASRAYKVETQAAGLRRLCNVAGASMGRTTKRRIPEEGHVANENHTYKVIELVGTSPNGVTEAINEAVSRASQTIKGLDWFEVQNIRGNIQDNNIAWYQVSLKIGFRVMSPEELKA